LAGASLNWGRRNLSATACPDGCPRRGRPRPCLRHRVAPAPEVRDRATGQAQRIGRGVAGEKTQPRAERAPDRPRIGGQQDLDAWRSARSVAPSAARRLARLGSSSATTRRKVAWISSQRRESIRESVKRFALELEREPGARRAQLSLRCAGETPSAAALSSSVKPRNSAVGAAGFAAGSRHRVAGARHAAA